MNSNLAFPAMNLRFLTRSASSMILSEAYDEFIWESRTDSRVGHVCKIAHIRIQDLENTVSMDCLQCGRTYHVAPKAIRDDYGCQWIHYDVNVTYRPDGTIHASEPTIFDSIGHYGD